MVAVDRRLWSAGRAPTGDGCDRDSCLVATPSAVRRQRPSAPAATRHRPSTQDHPACGVRHPQAHPCRRRPECEDGSSAPTDTAGYTALLGWSAAQRRARRRGGNRLLRRGLARQRLPASTSSMWRLRTARCAAAAGHRRRGGSGAGRAGRIGDAFGCVEAIDPACGAPLRVKARTVAANQIDAVVVTASPSKTACGH